MQGSPESRICVPVLKGDKGFGAGCARGKLNCCVSTDTGVAAVCVCAGELFSCFELE